MKDIKEFLRKFDSFGVSYSFKYKSQEKYKTSLGGLITIAFTTIALIIGIYYFIPFYNKQNFTIVYYVLKLAETEQIYFEKSKIAFSIGLNCWEDFDGTRAYDLFDIYHIYNYYSYENGEAKKKINYIGTHTCTHTDFYNEFNKSFDELGVSDYQCLDDLSRPMEGIYTSSVFSYYEFDVYAKNNSKDLLDKISDFLEGNDCKLQIFYIDKTIDINDYMNPIKGYLDTIFMQMNPTLSIRRNMYFMNQHLYDDDSTIWRFNEQEADKDSKISSLYSRYEEYSLYQGLNRTNTTTDYLNYIKLYFRADTRKTEVQRKYQKVMEFYADASSMLVAFYYVLVFILDFINTFYAELSLSKKIFIFKELSDNHLDVNKHSQKIKELFSLTKEHSKYYNFNTNIHEKDKKLISLESNKALNNANDYAKEIILFKPINKPIHKIKKTTKRNTIANLNLFKFKKHSVEFTKESKDKMKSQKLKTENMLSSRKNLNNIYDGYDKKKWNNIKEITLIKRYIKYDFNIFEIFIVSFCKCCQTQNLSLKNNLNEKANNILNNTLDIVSYVRNQMFLNIMNETIINQQIKYILNFLCHPILSINNEVKNEYTNFYNSFKENDFELFSEELTQLVKKKEQKIKEKKLISFTNEHLKELLVNNS